MPAAFRSGFAGRHIAAASTAAGQPKLPAGADRATTPVCRPWWWAENRGSTPAASSPGAVPCPRPFAAGLRGLLPSPSGGMPQVSGEPLQPDTPPPVGLSPGETKSASMWSRGQIPKFSRHSQPPKQLLIRPLPLGPEAGAG
ncbi:Uncharacterised protein [uncultured Blautia sp.]|nr:Uncharacterised protein [uncultured Blautia sp.]